MTFENEGAWDRAIRICAGIALEYAAWVTWPTTVLTQTGTVSLLFLLIGAIVLVTGLMGWCPVYALFNLSTNKRVSG